MSKILTKRGKSQVMIRDIKSGGGPVFSVPGEITSVSTSGDEGYCQVLKEDNREYTYIYNLNSGCLLRILAP